MSCVLNVQQMKAHRIGSMMSSPEFLFNYDMQILSISEKLPLLESILILYSCTLWDIIIFHGDLRPPIPKSTPLSINRLPLSQNLGVMTPNHPGLMPIFAMIVRVYLLMNCWMNRCMYV